MATRRGSHSERHTSLQVRFIATAAVLALVLFGLLMVAASASVLLTWVLAWTPVAFGLYGYDKMQAKRGALRVPELSLLVTAAAGGAFGALAGMLVFRHKTTRKKFWIVCGASAVAWGLLLLGSIG